MHGAESERSLFKRQMMEKTIFSRDKVMNMKRGGMKNYLQNQQVKGRESGADQSQNLIMINDLTNNASDYPNTQ